MKIFKRVFHFLKPLSFHYIGNFLYTIENHNKILILLISWKTNLNIPYQMESWKH